MSCTAFVNACVLDGTETMSPQPGMTVIVEGDRIVAVAPDGTVEIPALAHVVNLDGAYLMPGMVNLHVHLCGDGRPVSAGNAGKLIDLVLGSRPGMWYMRKRIHKSALDQLGSGVTTVRSVGDPGFADVDVRDNINSGKWVGPRLLVSGTGVTVPGGHGAGLFAQIVTTPEEGRGVVRQCAQRKVDLIKLFITGGVFDSEVAGEAGILRMSPEIAAAVVDEAHALGLPTAAHVESAEGVRVALDAGVDTIEHGARMSSDIVKGFKKNGVGKSSSLTCTISPALPFAELPAEVTHSTEVQKANGDLVYHGIVDAATQAVKARIPVGLGTDSACPYVTHYDFWREVVYFNRLVGVSPVAALHAATLGNARILKMDGEIGSIEVGKCADLVVLAKNPLEDLCALRKVEMVMARGVLNETPKHRQFAELDAALDRFAVMQQ